MINKAEAIRHYLLESGLATPTRKVIRELGEQGIQVTPQQVSNQKARLSRQGVVAQTDDLPVSVLKKVKRLVEELGSVRVLRQALDELEQLGHPPK